MTQQPWGNQQNPWGPPQGSPWGQQPPQQQVWTQPGHQPGWGQPGWGQPQAYQRPNYQYPTGMPPYPGQTYGRPPKRRRNPLVTFLKALFLLAVLGFIALTVLGFLLSYAANQVPAPQPTSGATQPLPTDPSDEPSEDPGPEPGGQSTTGPAASAPPANYQNEQYRVPPVDRTPPGLPQPETYEEATDLLKANPLYKTSVPRPVRCEMAELNMSSASRQELTTHLNEMMGCLMRVWDQPLTDAGFQAVRPSVTVYSGSVTTKCGKLPRANAVYCGADQQVYYAEDLPTVVPRTLRDSRFITESVVAHEFGHAVQARSAILVSELAWEEKSSKSTALELSRRLEVQADCFAGQFLGSIQTSTRMSDEELANVAKLFHSIGDDVLTGKPGYEGNHGSGTSRVSWTNAGLGSTSVGSCNTFTAPKSAVR
ncbi:MULTISPECIES: neutral zinc metallopeptidase [unclassified Luteococcus]|uniref:neutral zinc metallopeptidase n=1 Tax=unclassified Luteococcus TaxID=2639923 RepID=UPI00313D48EB